MKLYPEEILNVSCRLVKKARSLGLSMPTYIDPSTKYSIDTLESSGISIGDLCKTPLGYFLGNESRWDQSLCKFMTLEFLAFFNEKVMEENPATPDIDFLRYQRGEEKIFLSHYLGTDSVANEGYENTSPTIFVGEPRTIAIKMNVRYPNISLFRKGREAYLSKWVNMRYQLLTDGDVKLVKLPYFSVVEVRGDLKVQPVIKDLPGFMAKYSYCELADQVRALVEICFNIVLGTLDSVTGKVETKKFFDFLNLSLGMNEKFEVITSFTDLRSRPLLSDLVADRSESYRINPLPGRLINPVSGEDIWYHASKFRTCEFNTHEGMHRGVAFFASSLEDALNFAEGFAEYRKGEKKTICEVRIRLEDSEIFDSDLLFNDADIDDLEEAGREGFGYLLSPLGKDLNRELIDSGFSQKDRYLTFQALLLKDWIAFDPRGKGGWVGEASLVVLDFITQLGFRGWYEQEVEHKDPLWSEAYWEEITGLNVAIMDPSVIDVIAQEDL